MGSVPTAENSRTGELMRIYTDAPAFSDAITQALGRSFVLGPPKA